MVVPDPRPQLLRFGVFELNGHSGELRRNGMKIRLADQPFQILQLLLDRPGELVTREQIRQRLWSSDTYVDFDLSLNSAMRRLREALDDSADHPQFVETLPRRGYRFIAPVISAARNDTAPPAADDRVNRDRRVGRPWIAGAAALTLAIATLAVGLQRGWWGQPRAAVPIRSLAVLPFDNLTGDATQEYLVDGITDGLTTSLAQLGGFDVMSRTSVMRYKTAKKPGIARELGVDALLEGSVARTGGQVRITAQLIDAATDRHIWAQSYEGDLSEVRNLQQQIADAIDEVVGERHSQRARRAAAVGAMDPEAFEAYLKGLFEAGRAADRGAYEQYQLAIKHLEQAIERQPDFADAYDVVAAIQLQFLYDSPLSPHEAVPKAEMAARKAIALDETLPMAHRTLGAILQNYHWKWEEGDREFQRARELRGFLDQRGTGVPSLIRSGRLEEAIAETERARRLNPGAFNPYHFTAMAYRSTGQFDRAVAELQKGIALHPDLPRAHFQLGVTFVLMGRLQDAIGAFEKVADSSMTGNPRFQAYLGYAYAVTGRTLEARRILEALETRARQQYVSSFGLALIYDALGEKAQALAAFERAYQDHAVEFAQVAQYPPFRTIAGEPRFVERMRQIGLPR